MADYDPATQRALFAQTFSGTTNLDQRRRFAQELSDAKARDEERRQADFQAAQERNPQLMNAVTKRMGEERQFDTQRFNQNLAQQKLDIARDTADLKRQAETRMVEKTKLDIEKARYDLDRKYLNDRDTADFDRQEFELRSSGVIPGSSAYQRAVTDILIGLPHIDKDFRNMALKSAGINDPDQAWKEASDAVQKGASRASFKTPSGVSVTMQGEKPEKPEDIDAELAKAYALRDRATRAVDEGFLKLANEKVAALEAKKAGTQTQSAPAIVPERRRASDGSVWEFDPSTKKPIRKVE